MPDKTLIYINTLPVHSKTGGIRTFLLEMLYGFARAKNSLFDYCLICSENNKLLFEDFDNYDNFKRIIVGITKTNPVERVYFEQLKLNKLFKKNENAILLNICNTALLRCPIPQVTIIQAQQGIAELRREIPKKYISVSIGHRIYYDLFLEKTLKISARIVAISHYMVQYLKKYNDKTVVIHEGVNLSEFQQLPSGAEKKYDFPYIFSLSTLFPHKNMDLLIQAFSLYKKSNPSSYKLLIAGKDPDGTQLKRLREIAIAEQVDEEVILLGWVDKDDIPGLYKNSSLFMYLSSMEFFGLPVLEAMACGVPVIAANRMSIPEVVNDAGILVEPEDIVDVAKKMESVLTSEKVSVGLVNKGTENIKSFSWDITVAKFNDVFASIVQGN